MVKKLTDIEKIVRSILLDIGEHFIIQHYIGNYPVDFYLPKYKLSIECDGCYYHRHDSLVCKVKKVPRQLFQNFRDKACNAYHRYHKINIIRFYGCTIHTRPHEVKDKITDSIEKIKTGRKVYK
jgi:G:T-mismatch repair DNA endonuclease (very short patch repair protein)